MAHYCSTKDDLQKIIDEEKKNSQIDDELLLNLTNLPRNENRPSCLDPGAVMYEQKLFFK